jgi:hypothetical protein
MKRIFTILSLAFIGLGSVSGQTINTFESGSPAVVTRYGATFSKVANPSKTGLNTSANVGKIGRTSPNWYELIAFPANFPIPANLSKYVHVLINYPAQPDISIRIDAADETNDGGVDIRSINADQYTQFGKWFNLTFKIDSTTSARTVKAILYLGDLGFNNNPAGFVTNDGDKPAYVDQFVVSNNPILTNTKNIELIKSVNIYPNPTTDQITISNVTNDTQLSIFGIDGKEVMKVANSSQTSISIPVTDWQKGTYYLTVTKDGDSVFKQFIVQ